MTTHQSLRPTRSARSTGWVPFALVALVAIPAVAGSLRLVELAPGVSEDEVREKTGPDLR